MDEKFKSKALEANLAETRYKDIKISPDYQAFIDLSKNTLESTNVQTIASSSISILIPIKNL